MSDIQNIKNNVSNFTTAVNEAKNKINELSASNPDRTNLTNELNSAATIETINDIKNRAIEAKRNDIGGKRDEAKREVEALPSDIPETDKKHFKDSIEKATTEAEITEIKKEVSIAAKKQEVRREANKLLLKDLSQRNPQGQPPTFIIDKNLKIWRKDTEYAIDNIYNMITQANNNELIKRAKQEVEKQKNAEIGDLNKPGTSGTVSPDDSVIKSKLLRDISFTDVKHEYEPFEAKEQEYLSASNSLREEINALNGTGDYKAKYNELETKVQKFIIKYKATDTTPSWVYPYIDRIKKKSTGRVEGVNDAFNVSVADALINNAISSIKGAQNEEAAKDMENRYLRGVYFMARRTKKIDYEYNHFIQDVKRRPIWDQTQKDALEYNLHLFRQASTLEEKKRVAQSIGSQVNIPGHNPTQYMENLLQQRKVEWWVTTISNSTTMSIDDKYKWIDKIAINIDNTDSLNQLRDDFINAGFRSVLQNGNPPGSSANGWFPDGY